MLPDQRCAKVRQVKTSVWPNVSPLSAERSCIVLVIIYTKRDPFPDERRGVRVTACPHALGISGFKEAPGQGRSWMEQTPEGENIVMVVKICEQ